MVSVLRRFRNTDVSPTKVIAVKVDNYKNRHIFCREDCLIVYEPQTSQNEEERQKYEIVLHRPSTETLHQAYSLFRSEEKDETEIKFIRFKGTIPILIEIGKEMCNLQGIQKICDILTKHSTWTLAHLAAHFALYDAFYNTKVKSYLNSSDATTGISPLQVAIKNNNLKMVQTLVASKCCLQHFDHQANSVFHYAASTNVDIIAVLAQNSIPPHSLNSRNRSGQTPLHMACLADKTDCVKALLLAGADVNITASQASPYQETAPAYVSDFLQDHPNSLYVQDMKFGGTPLHWACSRRDISALVDMNCNINAVNFEQRTALHLMVLRNRLECLVALLCRKADPDLGDYEGNAPLHLAVKESNIPMIQCLIIFGANLDIVNNNGYTPRHLITAEQEPKILYYLHAVGAKRCPEGIPECTEGCSFNGIFDGVPPTPVIGPPKTDVLNQILADAGMENSINKQDPSKKQGRLLCLDGSSTRGLVLIQLLLELEKVCEVPINNCFDWIAGTSTGGILALGLATGKTLMECLFLYFRMKELTFIELQPYSSERFENILKDAFGIDGVMSDIKKPKLIITGCFAHRKPAELHLFRNYKSPSSILGIKNDCPYELPEEQLIWHVARSTVVAPTYLKFFRQFLDGGLIANNPTLDAMTEIHEYNLALSAVGRESEVDPLSVVVSLGTGLKPVTQIRATDVFRPESFWNTTDLRIGMASLGNLLVDQATASDGRVVDRARSWCSMIGVPYFRYSPQMSEDIPINEKSDEKLCKMLWEAKSYIHANPTSLKEVADILLN